MVRFLPVHILAPMDVPTNGMNVEVLAGTLTICTPERFRVK